MRVQGLAQPQDRPSPGTGWHEWGWPEFLCGNGSGSTEPVVVKLEGELAFNELDLFDGTFLQGLQGQIWMQV